MKRGETFILLLGGVGGCYVLGLSILDLSGIYTLVSDLLQQTYPDWFIALFLWTALPVAAVFGLWQAIVAGRYGPIRSKLAADPYYLIRGRDYVDFALSDADVGALCEAMSRLSAVASATDPFYVRNLKRYMWHLRRHWLPSPGAVRITRALTLMAEQELQRHPTNTVREERSPL